jgi:hypothetical protein
MPLLVVNDGVAPVLRSELLNLDELLLMIRRAESRQCSRVLVKSREFAV